MSSEKTQNIGQPEKHIRDLDPNVLQRRASDPKSHIWVNASAGTGKTKILSDRVLRLLLPGHSDSGNATPPHKILCLTFTKAGASEMSERVQNILSEWSVCGHKELTGKLEKLLGKQPTQDQIKHARELFSRVIDHPGGLNIMTIHSFAQSILGRFPLEAKVSPHMRVVDDQEAQELLNSAIMSTYRNKDKCVYRAIQNLSAVMSEDQFHQLVANMVQEENQLLKLSEDKTTLLKSYQELLKLPSMDKQNILEHACDDRATNMKAVKNIAEIMLSSGGKKDKERGEIIINWLSLDLTRRIHDFEIYSRAFLKQDHNIYSALVSKAVLKISPNAEDVLYLEAERLQNAIESLKNIDMAVTTQDLILAGHDIVKNYQSLKLSHGVMDYNDLINRVLRLLENTSMRGWVHYKLDQGIDHILVDEAQDTNPEQWQIIKALSDEFFSGQARTATHSRTMFVVGDEKQSIYSFQRAAPEEFSAMRAYFETKSKDAKQDWAQIDMNISFRSTSSVLSCVDHVFAPDNMRTAISSAPVQHFHFRRGQAGKAVLWPVFESDKDDQNNGEGLPLPTHITQSTSGTQKLARFIAQNIRRWLDDQEMLDSKNRPIQPGDIMILTRTRSALSFQILKELKNQKIPIGGADRINLSEEIIVQDVMAVIDVLLQSHDDLSLASALKSPLINMDEETLFDLAHDRDGSLINQLQCDAYIHIYNYFSQLKKIGAEKGPYALIQHILNAPCPADARSGMRAFQNRLGNHIVHIFDVFLDEAYHFENDHIVSLQYFSHWMQKNAANIKKEQEDSHNAVRLMTIHGSKGLQAPIVILPDTMRVMRSVPSQIDKRLLWPQKTDLPLPLFTTRKDEASAFYQSHYQKLEARADDEYRRLLYVAMTRAEDRLYIAGATSLKKPLDDSWYFDVKRGFETHRDTRIDIISFDNEDYNIAIIDNPQTKDTEIRQEPESPSQNTQELPQWLTVSAPDEPFPPAPLRPSQQDDIENDQMLVPLFDQSKQADSPAGSKTIFDPRRRGIIIHKMLEFLAGKPADEAEIIARKFLALYGQDMTHRDQDDVIEQINTLLSDPQTSHYLTQNGLSEVPVCGVIDGRIINGQIDRLIINDTDIWILDYKTGRRPPEKQSDIPKSYRTQMHLYSLLIKQIYPDHAIHKALLWTEGPKIMILQD